MNTVLFATYSGLLGGAERVLLDCAASLDENCLLACPPGPLADAARAAGVTVLPLPSRSLRLRGTVGQQVRAGAALAAHAVELRRLSRDLDVDLVVAWGMRSALAALALPRGVAYAVDHHDLLPGPVLAWLVRLAVRGARVVTVPSRAVADDIDRGRPLSPRLRVVAPGIDVEDLAATDAPPATLVTVGAITAWKRPDLALEILAVARRQRKELALRVVGGPVSDSDEALVLQLQARARAGDLNGAVTFTGAVADVAQELARASCLLHCATAEPFGIVLLEAMAAGRPVVAPDAAGPREIVDASCGILYAPGDARAGAEAVLSVLADGERSAKMGAAGRERVQRHFSRQQSRQGFEAALAPVLADRHRRRRRASPAQLAVVTVTHNSAESLAGLICSMQRHLPGAALTVVDCASTDASVRMAQAAAGTRVICLDANVGFGRACNRGLQDITAPVVALLNPDVEVIDDSLLALAAEALDQGRPERLFAPLVLNTDSTRQETVHPPPAGASDLARALIPAALVPGPWLAPWRARAPRRVGWAVGAALLARTDTLRHLGPFDEAIFMYGEDMELGLRASQNGIATWFWPAARVRHSGGHATTAAFDGEPFARLAEARHQVVRRRLGPARARRDARAQALTFVTRAALRRVLGQPDRRQRQQLAAVRALPRDP